MAEEMTDDERYYVTKERATTKVGDLGEILTYPAQHIFHGTMSEKIVKDVTEYCAQTNNDKASEYLVANLKGTQSELDPWNPLMKEFIEKMMLRVCKYVEECEMYNRERTIDIAGCWDVKYEPGDYNPLHMHGTQSKEGLASIFYLKVPESIDKAWVEGTKNPKYTYSSKKDGVLKLMWGLPRSNVADEFECATNTYIKPEVGDFYIFNKTLNHEVMPFTEKEDRWSVQVNFNCWAKDEKLSYEAQKAAGYEFHNQNS